MKLSDIGEFGLIARIAAGTDAGDARLIRGIGDDCAVVETGDPGRALLLTTDTLVEGVHFTRASTSPRLLGRKALAASLSDIAAMGGTPTVFTVSLAAPPALSVAWVDAFYAGLRARARASGAALAGGDTSSAPSRITVSVGLLGECPADEIVYRRGAHPGDGVYVTGRPGESAAGLAILRAEAAGGGDFGEAFSRLKARHLDPEPRLAAGRHLAAHGIASAMIDVSDGILADLGHILEIAKAGAAIQVAALPLSADLQAAAEHMKIDPAGLALTGGEDYELLFTARADLDVAALSKALSLEITRIGRVTPPGTPLRVLDPSGNPRPLSRAGHDHFRSAPRPGSDFSS